MAFSCSGILVPSYRYLEFKDSCGEHGSYCSQCQPDIRTFLLALRDLGETPHSVHDTRVIKDSIPWGITAVECQCPTESCTIILLMLKGGTTTLKS